MTEDLQSRKEKIDKACAWYRSHEGAIAGMLPLRIPHEGTRGFSLYPENWCPMHWIAKWENQTLPLAEAEVLISGQLRPLFPIVRDRMVGTYPGK
jgi:hypothetical protein